VATTQRTQADLLPLPAGDWHVVPARSELGFLARVLGLIPVRGRYSGYDGELHINSAGNASGVLRIEAATISTGIKTRDAHLRSTEFFAVEEHSHLTFELTSLVRNTDRELTLTGTLHIRDQALPINTPVSVATLGPDGPDGSDERRIDADFEVDHRASGLDFKWVRAVRVQAALTLKRLNDALDPNEIQSPGKQGIWPGALRPERER
jgi:polyisoprenoid-binding protein YceI